MLKGKNQQTKAFSEDQLLVFFVFDLHTTRRKAHQQVGLLWSLQQQQQRGGDKVIWGRFITGDSGEDKEANTAQVWCRRCAEVVLVLLPLVSLCPPLLALTSHHSAALLRLYLALIRHSTALTFSPFMVQTRRTKRATIPIVEQLKRSVLSTHLQVGFFLAAIENVRKHLQRVYKYDYCDGGDRNDKHSTVHTNMQTGRCIIAPSDVVCHRDNKTTRQTETSAKRDIRIKVIEWKEIIAVNS